MKTASIIHTIINAAASHTYHYWTGWKADEKEGENDEKLVIKHNSRIPSHGTDKW